ncbi:MAG: LacI family DNA-binding transcriptional regulator [Candidatus Limnocylindrales bacterium]
MTNSHEQRAATLADVAAAVGLSPAAVSLALRGKAGVSEATRTRVVEAARRLGYRPVATGSRQHQKPITFGLVINPVHGGIQEANRFYAPVIAGIQASCRSHHMDLMLATMPVDQHQYPIELPRIVTNRTCDGLIVVGAHLSRATTAILRTAPPAILVDAYADDDAFDSVVMDNVGGARTAVEHLVSLGHRNIAILATEPQAYPSILQRRLGYDQALAAAGLTPHFIDALYWEPDSAAVFALAYLKDHPEVSAVFCANDLVAVSLLQAARQEGIAVPDRLSVVGYDDIDLAGFVHPALTTMAVDKVGMGRLAVTLLAHRLEFGKECVTQTFVRPTLVERETTRAVEPAAPQEEDAVSLRADAQPAW